MIKVKVEVEVPVVHYCNIGVWDRAESPQNLLSTIGNLSLDPPPHHQTSHNPPFLHGHKNQI